MRSLEICANSVASALAAQNGGAIRIEFCDNLKEGGTTPSYGQITVARQLLHIKLYVIIRPRGGDFLYSDLEFEIMKQDIELCKQAGADGVVFGILNADGTVDKKRCKELLELAKPLAATFHRAFDMCSDPFTALEEIIEMRFERILTSGGETTAIEGIDQIEKLVKQANGRISIMPGSGVNENNILKIAKQTRANEFHTTAKSRIGSNMTFQNSNAAMSPNSDEFLIEQTDEKTVKKLVSLLETASSS
ncbi:copper homeostasis protein CutC [Rubrolithibacter danxiaensis]|uniref:copper homeostasis protein CutC n=1 Tax=Rubrolithibacter danxiaensis TaxID=3390805 RepID=UPI003BF915FA